MTVPRVASTSSAATRLEIALIAAVCAALCIVLGWTSRTALNPDGVSYLDIAARFSAGDWSGAVQGYWSPLYPLLLAVLGTATGATGTTLLVQVHFLNVGIALGIVALLWRSARAHGDPIVARALFAAFLLASARTPRLDAVTPDLLLIGAVLVLGGELLRGAGSRWYALGAWFGVIFLTKTSSWPWLLVTAALLAIAGDRAMRRTLVRAGGVALAVMALWVVPLSLKSGRPTLGSAGAFNACWYLERCDSRTPDEHSGAHARYGGLRLADGELVTVADFSNTQWTYAPWSDPTAWQAEVRSINRAPLDLFDLVGYWSRQGWAVVSLWTPQLLLFVLLPVAILSWRRGLLATGWREQRMAVLLVLLGLAGIAQFIVVHAEPRLIAPFVLLASIGCLWWWRPPGMAASGQGFRSEVVLVLGWVGLVSALLRGAIYVPELMTRTKEDTARFERLRQAGVDAVPGGLAGRAIVVVGPAIPVVSDAWLFGARIVAQIPPGSASRIRAWTPAQQREMLRLLGRGDGDVAWMTATNGSILMAPIVRSTP
ncbi:MAG: hypothetical protein IPP98_08960 [Gemmatimonadetes bacterium]|nr:hypothetical protein [Gemmatimonadota bacterium]